jgi:prepilin-type N-terminal cleavage/methylation domain-containing protein
MKYDFQTIERCRGFTLVEMSVGLLMSSVLIGVTVEAWTCFHRVSVDVSERCRLAQEADLCLLRIAEDLRAWNKRPWMERAVRANKPACVDHILVIPESDGYSVRYILAMDDPDDLDSAHLIRERYLAEALLDSQRIGTGVQGIDLSWNATGTLATVSLRMASSYRIPSQPAEKTLEFTSSLLLVTP